MVAGVYSLTMNDDASDLTIGAAGTSICELIEGLDGMTAVSLSAYLAYGSGGTSIAAYVQTRFGNLWVDIAHFGFTTATAHKGANLSGLTPVTTLASLVDGGLSANTCQDGILGDALRAKIVSTGTYAGPTVLVIRASVR